jgi:hypothetical protein
MQKFDHNIGFVKNADFFAENCRKSHKIMIKTLNPGVILYVVIKTLRPTTLH